MAQTLSEIKSLLAMHGLRPKHRLGQNFLHDSRKFELILEAAEIRPGDMVLEVGPGTGALTQRLLEAGARVVAVEIDAHLEPILREVTAAHADRFTLIVDDVLSSKHEINPRVIEALAGHTSQSTMTFKCIANLPYNVASPLLANLAINHPQMTLAVVTIQREVADRLTAGPGTEAYGPLGVLLQAMCEIKRVTILPPGCFWPSPKVDSAAVRLVRRDQPLADDPRALAATLHRLFSKRRKQIGSILGRHTPLPPGIEPRQRPEELSVEQLIQLSR